jgi:hypothetical protein
VVVVAKAPTKVRVVGKRVKVEIPFEARVRFEGVKFE